MLKTGMIIVVGMYLVGGLAFAVMSGADYLAAGWSFDKALTIGVERAVLWPEELIRMLT
jgi:hypothetical protein